MKSRRIWAIVVAAAAVAVVIPAAVGASPKAKAGGAPTLCSATGVKPVGNNGAINFSAKGKATSSDGKPVNCAVKVKGKWKKNSTTFSLSAHGNATLGKDGAFTLDPKVSLAPLTGKVTGTLTGAGGGGSTGTAIWIEIHCWYSYPPLRYGCEVIIHPGPDPSA